MTPGLRKYKSASLRLAVPFGIEDADPAETERLREGIVEIIDLQSGNARKGHATALLKNVCVEADVEQKVLMLQVNAFDDGMGNEQLQRWYERNDFKVVQTSPVLLMTRVPQ